MERKSPEAKSEVLAEFSQADLIDSFQLKSFGVCAGNTNFWLCYHMLMPAVSSLAELKTNEQHIMKQIKSNFGDVLLLQKHFFQSCDKSLADLGLATFSKIGRDAIFTIGPSCNIVYDASKPIENRAAELSTAVCMLMGGGSSTAKQFINFCFSWTDDRPSRGEDEVLKKAAAMVHPIDRRVHRGHSVGIIINPCAGCEVVFFDSNHDSRAFPKKEDFYGFIKAYFQFKMRDNGVPTLWQSYMPISKPLQLQKLPQSDLRAVSHFKELKLDIRDTSTPPSSPTPIAAAVATPLAVGIEPVVAREVVIAVTSVATPTHQISVVIKR